MTLAMRVLLPSVLVCCAEVTAMRAVLPVPWDLVHRTAALHLERVRVGAPRAAKVVCQSPDAAAALTQGKVAQMLEATFVRACMDVATGNIDTLKLFIVAAKAGYEMGWTLNTIELELGMCPPVTSGRPLAAEEVECRSLWLILVYLALEDLQHPAENRAAVCATELEPHRAQLQAAHS